MKSLSQSLQRKSLSLASLRHRLKLLKWLVPVGLMASAIAYELGPARWIFLNLGLAYHLLAESVIFAVVGPALAYLLLELLERWLAERETSDLQARMLAEVRAEAKYRRDRSDDALQVLFAAGALIAALKSLETDRAPEITAQLEHTEQALNRAVEQLRSHLG